MRRPFSTSLAPDARGYVLRVSGKDISDKLYHWGILLEKNTPIAKRKETNKPMTCFNRCRAERPAGYAGFHLPWVLEWLETNRQYKQACELMKGFPGVIK